MGKLFRSWFKKKKKQGSIHSQHSSPHQLKTDTTNYATPQQQPVIAKIRPKDDDALAFTKVAASSSLLDDVLGGWRGQTNDEDEDIRTIEGIYAPDLPPSSTSYGHRHSSSKSGTHFDNPHQSQQQQQQHRHHQQQHHNHRHPKNQTTSGFSDNDRSSIYQQNRTQTQQPPPCRTAPETPGYSPCPPPPPSSSSSSSQDSMVIATPSSATTPFLSPFTKSSSPPPLLPSSSSPALFDQNNSTHSSNTPSNPDHAGTTTVGAQSHDLTTVPMTNFDQQQQRPRTLVQKTHSHPQLLQQSDQQNSINPSHEEKRSRYLQATGVSMTRMKERHRQECRRSMQPTSNQLTISSPPQQQQQQQQQQANLQPQQQIQPSTLSPSPSSLHLPFQRNLPVQNKVPPQRPFLPSPSMPALNPSAPASTFASSSFSPVMPAAPVNSVARSFSMMTDLHHHPRSTTTATGWKGSTTSLSTMGQEQQSSQPHQQQLWRQHALFPYQSDIVLPPYNPAQLTTIHHHNQAPLMTMPHSTSYRVLNNSGNNSSGTHPQAFPRSVSVYGGQSDTMRMSNYGSRSNGYGSPGYLLRSTMMTDPNVGLGTINSMQQQQQYQRKSMSAFPRSYKPQLSISNSIQPQQQQQQQQPQQQQKKVKRHSENMDALEDQNVQSTSNDTTMELPASFLPSSYSPSSNTHGSTKVESEVTTVTESSSSESPLPSLSSSSKTPTSITTGDQSSIINREDPAENHSATPTKTGNSGLDEKLEIPSLVEHLPTKWQQQAELRVMAKRKTHRRRRFSLPTLPTISPSSSSSSIDDILDRQKEAAVDTTTDGSKRSSPSTPPADPSHDKCSSSTTVHASCNSIHHYPSPPPVPACSISNGRIPALPSHGPWSCHSCAPSSPPLALCCPSHTCEPSSSIPAPMSASCCSSSSSSPPCCSYHHHHHHHSHRHHRSQKQHRCHHHRSQPPSGMKKSTSMVPPSKLRQKGQKRQDALPRDDEDNETIAATEPALPPKKPMSSYSLQRPSLRSFLPPRFSTSIPRLQQEKPSTSSRSSWIPSRS